MTSADIDTVSRMDREAFGADRRFFLERRVRLFPHLCKAMETEGAISGFCVGQPGHEVISIGPWLVGDGVKRPMELLEGIAADTGSAELRLGILESSSVAVDQVRALQGLTETKPSWRMVLGPDAGLGASPKLYAIGSGAKG
jgi:hypothetical protein